ncbi:hypothetical protein WOSG25_050530 [Weissella oryzae SG25]|uniref:Uncharacterized protein n=1 Tax=Weissella oryzae (strain DSM 25784 / JCM 18191 / LMG 30913 / SG25) TaxID=1329250 RepID=A0A069D0G1_WEIOS|nr:hypothetical protein [Weissella oryzae]GAK30781.1 hypothetical protein WOSG25_050530 [Weissella oryzae SG25]
MKWAKYFWVLASLLLVGYVWQSHTLQTTNSKLSRVQADNKGLKKRLAVQKEQQVALPDVKETKDKSLNEANEQVKQTMQLVVNSDPRQFDTSLVGKVSPAMITKLKSELTPTVTASQFSGQNIVYIGVVNQYESPLNFMLVSKNDTQQNAYYVTYDLSNNEITSIDRAALKGAFNELN